MECKAEEELWPWWSNWALLAVELDGLRPAQTPKVALTAGLAWEAGAAHCSSLCGTSVRNSRTISTRTS